MVVLKLNLASLPKHPSSSTPSAHPPSADPLRVVSAVGGVPSIPRIRVKSAASASTKIRIKNQKDVGLGYDSEASDREDDPAIEEQIILRCRPGEDAEYLRGCLERKEVPDMMIKFKGNLPPPPLRVTADCEILGEPLCGFDGICMVLNLWIYLLSWNLQKRWIVSRCIKRRIFVKC